MLKVQRKMENQKHHVQKKIGITYKIYKMENHHVF
jgi:hypothetical protein